MKVYLFEASSPTWQVHCQGNFEAGLFQDVTIHDTSNIGQYRLGLQSDSLGRNHLYTAEETRQQD